MVSNFSHWVRWDNRNSLANFSNGGVYVIAAAKENEFGDTQFSWSEKIIYIGVTRAKGGLKSRVDAFDRTMRNVPPKTFHGGAERLRWHYSDYAKFKDSVWIAISTVKKYKVPPVSSSDYRAMGDALKLEYDCFAEYFEKHENLPLGNDWKRSPKKGPSNHNN